MKVSQRVSVLHTPIIGSTLGWSEFTKGYNSVKSVDRVMVLNVSTLSDDALYNY